jgi:hypothetical protein
VHVGCGVIKSHPQEETRIGFGRKFIALTDIKERVVT